MNVLALETSGTSLGAAVIEKGRVLASSFLDRGYLHAERLMPTVDSLCGDLGLRPEDIDLIAVSAGPGSFTGLRVGVTTARTLAWSLGARLVAVSTFDVLAYSARLHRGTVGCLLDARRGAVFASFYDFSQRPAPADIPGARQGKSARLDMEGLAAELRGRADEDVVLVGPAVAVLGPRIEEAISSPGAFRIAWGDHQVRPEALGLLALLLAQRGQSDDPMRLEPDYLRPPGVGRRRA